MRRALLVCLFILLAIASNAQVRKQYTVILRSNIGTDTMWDGVAMRIFGMTSKLTEQPAIPAATLYCNEGDTLVLNAKSISQGDHHTIHLHGMDADTRNDGDPATSFRLAHMQDTTYTVVADHAGTYIYHCHETDVIHVQMGMYGLVVVRPRDGGQTAWTNGPHYDKSLAWLTSEIDRSWHDNIPKHDTVADTIHVPPYRPGYFLINGKSESQLANDASIRIDGSARDEVYVRLANIGFFLNRIIFPHAAHARVLDSDGRPLDDTILTDTVDVAPGERYGVMLSMPSDFADSVRVQYVNMNTDSVWSTQRVPLTSNGARSIPTAPASRLMSLYPNPSHHTITILGAPPHAPFECVDCLGRTVLFGLLDERETIDVEGLPAGLYLIRIGDSFLRFARD